MTTPCVAPSRRDLIVGATAAAAFTGACARPERRSGWLNYLLGLEPDTLDPARCAGGTEICIMAAIFEPLVQPHPENMSPMAGVATNYKVDRGGTRYTFLLRGHPAPDGIRLPGAETLSPEFTRGRATGPRDVPARWSDGTPITAHDLVYSWRRYLAAETGNFTAYLLYCVTGAEAVTAGKAPPEQLGVRALDAFTFEVDLRAPAPYFLKLCACYLTLPLPSHTIEAARKRGRESSWVEPGRIVTSGPFRMVESRPRERTVVAKNQDYFDAALGEVEGITFSAADGVVVLNLFRAGLADSMEGRALPLQLASRVRRIEGFHVTPACASYAWRINTHRPPLDNVLMRYALNMATDKEETVRLLGTGQRPAKTRVPVFEGYRPPETMPVEINGRVCDVLSFDPRTARELWAASAAPEARLPLPIHYMARADSRLLAEVLQYQWRLRLGLETRLMPQEFAAFVSGILEGNEWSGVAEEPYGCNYAAPNDLLTFFTANYPHWSDSGFDKMLTAASSTADPSLRMEKLSACEARLLRGMPFVPLYFDAWNYLEREDVRGLRLNPLDSPSFKYAWIDSARRVG